MIPIHGLTVCVSYGDYLLHTLPLWLQGLQTLTVVTTRWDDAVPICNHYASRLPAAVTVFCTDAFTLNWASFNKGLAMEEARRYMPWEDWILFFDCDILPQPAWWESLDDLQLGYLYGAKRRQLSMELTGDPYKAARLDAPFEPDDRIGYGYFQLFHSQDPKVQRTPLLDTQWKHAGNYDSNFLLSFRSMVKELPINLWHLGDRGNWWGRGQQDAMIQMEQTRAGKGIHESEKL